MRFLFYVLFSFILLLPSAAQSIDIITYRVMSKAAIEDFGETFGVTEKSTARPITPVALEMVKHFEGWIPTAYDDPVKLCTIGYGHLIAMKSCKDIDLGKFSKELSEVEGAALLEDDMIGARLAVQSLVKTELNDEQFGALASFVFNVGKGNFQKSTMLSLINEGGFEAAAGQFVRWSKAKGRLLPGLVARRACEEFFFRGYLTLDKNGRFDRSACQSLGIATDTGTLIDIDIGEI